MHWNSSSNRQLVVALGISLVTLSCIVSVALLGFGAGVVVGLQQRSANQLPLTVGEQPDLTPPTSVPAVPRDAPTETPQPEAVGTETVTAPDLSPNLPVPDQINQDPIDAEAMKLLDVLTAMEFPPRDYHENAQRLGAEDVGPRTIQAPAVDVGSTREFVTDSGLTMAELAYVSEHAYWWTDRDLSLSEKKLVDAVQRFEAEYYPSLVASFGEEWRPGMDGDPRFHVLHLASFADSSEIGFFDSGDEYPRSVNDASNEAEIVYLNMAYLTLGEDLYFGTLSHEFMHLVQWHLDGNETTWLDEGLAQLAEKMVGLDTVDTYLDWQERPTVQLNRWDFSDDGVYASYGAAYLFAVYLWEQLGPEAIKDLAQHPANGLEAVQAVLKQYAPEQTATAFVGSWAVANWLDGRSSERRYTYKSLDLTEPVPIVSLKHLPFETVKQASQYGVHYIDLRLGDPITVTFAGDTLTPLIDVPPHSGTSVWLAPAVDNMSAHLSRTFDLAGLDSATLSFWAWYDLEVDWDFAYVTASDDGGQTWRILEPENAVVGQYGPALGGRSEGRPGNEKGWVHESIELDAYAGKQVTIRFDVLTDATQREGGFALDDIGIVELGEVSGGEAADPTWSANGFARSGWQLPQAWSVYVIDNGAPYHVEQLELDALNQGQWHLEGSRYGLTLVIMAQSPFTRESASYWLWLDD